MTLIIYVVELKKKQIKLSWVWRKQREGRRRKISLREEQKSLIDLDEEYIFNSFYDNFSNANNLNFTAQLNLIICS